MRTDQDDGTQGGRGEPSAALSRCFERHPQLHPDYDRNQYVKRRHSKTVANDVQLPTTLSHLVSLRKGR